MNAATALDAGPMGRSKALDDSLARAHQLAVAQGHAAVALEHLLFSLQDDPDGQAILASSGVNRDGLAADVSNYLGRLSETSPAVAGAAPQPGPDLLRILQLAAMAARQSQRRVMDGAIVLAAVIGDGNSPAAGMLKAQGLTFDAAIKAIAQSGAPRQQEVAAPKPKVSLPAPEMPAPRLARVTEAPSTDSMLADVRARVKQAEPATIPIKTVDRPVPAKAAARSELRPPPPLAPPVAIAGTAAETAILAAAPSQPQPKPEPSPPLLAPTFGAAASALSPSHVSDPVPGLTQSTPALSTLRRSPKSAVNLPPPLPPGQGAVRPPLPSTVPQQQSPVDAPVVPRPAAPPPPYPVGQPMAPPAPSPAAVQPAPPPQVATSAPAPAVAPLPSPPPVFVPVAQLNVVAAAAGLPATMRLGTPVLVEVRIPRDQIDVPRRRGQMLGGNGDPPIYRVVSVRLGTGGVSGLAIEPRSPETIWIGMGRDVDALDFVWQFVVTPTRAGRFAVTLGVSGRTISPYGVAGDGTPLSETFAVAVKRQAGGRFKRFLVATLVFALGAATAVVAGGPIIAATKALLARLIQ